jgi:hypothetical protein
MRKHSRRSHSPRPFRTGSHMWIDGFYRCSKVKGDHAGCYCSHTRRLYSGCWSLVGRLWVLGGAIIVAIVAGSDSSMDTGAGRHRIAWEMNNVRRCICGYSTSRGCAWRCHKRIWWFPKISENSSGGPVKYKGQEESRISRLSNETITCDSLDCRSENRSKRRLTLSCFLLKEMPSRKGLSLDHRISMREIEALSYRICRCPYFFILRGPCWRHQMILLCDKIC